MSLLDNPKVLAQSGSDINSPLQKIDGVNQSAASDKSNSIIIPNSDNKQKTGDISIITNAKTVEETIHAIKEQCKFYSLSYNDVIDGILKEAGLNKKDFNCLDEKEKKVLLNNAVQVMSDLKEADLREKCEKLGYQYDNVINEILNCCDLSVKDFNSCSPAQKIAIFKEFDSVIDEKKTNTKKE